MHGMKLLNDYVLIEVTVKPDSLAMREPVRGIVAQIGDGVKPWHDQHNPNGLRLKDEVLFCGWITSNGNRFIVKLSNIIGIYEKGAANASDK